jgi:ABC-type cobalamin/Fe3+-siderophores transport system ATPase subunit
LSIDKGERVALLGPNGAGKTTLVMHLNGILTPGLGTVSVGGLPVYAAERAPLIARESMQTLKELYSKPSEKTRIQPESSGIAQACISSCRVGLRGA